MARITRARDKTGGLLAAGHRARQPSRAAGATARPSRAVRWQVFGLAGLAAVSDYHWPPTCHRFPG